MGKGGIAGTGGPGTSGGDKLKTSQTWTFTSKESRYGLTQALELSTGLPDIAVGEQELCRKLVIFRLCLLTPMLSSAKTSLPTMLQSRQRTELELVHAGYVLIQWFAEQNSSR